MSQETIPLVLESCPFCESPAEIAIWGRTSLGAQYYVCCTNIVDCRCMTPWNYSVLLVVAHWNRRPSAQAVDWRAEYVRAVAGYLSDMHGESEQDAVSMAEAKAQSLQAEFTLAMAQKGIRSETPPEVMAELCRVYLAWRDAPEVRFTDGSLVLTAADLPEMVGRRFKLVEIEQ